MGVSYFNPRSPSGLRQTITPPDGATRLFQSTQPEWAATLQIKTKDVYLDISIHAARVGCDASNRSLRRKTVVFQSTQPEWAATVANKLQKYAPKISIHAARVGCDSRRQNRQRRYQYISIHAARVGCDAVTCIKRFVFVISIHAARVGCDTRWAMRVHDKGHFNPRSPSGLRH